MFGTLLGDDERVYDLNTIDDQLVLGIKGTMSVVELKVIKTRRNSLAGSSGGACPGRSHPWWLPGQAAPKAASTEVAPWARRRTARRLGFCGRGWSKRWPKECLLGRAAA